MIITAQQTWHEFLRDCREQDSSNGVWLLLQAAGLAFVISFLITATITIFSASLIACAQVMEHLYNVHIDLAPYFYWQESAVTYSIYAGMAFAAAALIVRLRLKNPARQPLTFHPMSAGTSEALMFFGVAQEEKSPAANQSSQIFPGTSNSSPPALTAMPYLKG